jgi:hypothetical protein
VEPGEPGSIYLVPSIFGITVVAGIVGSRRI